MPKSKKENIEEITLDPIEEKVKEPAPVEEPEENIEEPETVEEDAGEEITEPVEFEEPLEGEPEDVEFDEDAEPEEETGNEESDEGDEGDEPAPFLGLMMSGAKNAPVSEDPDPQSRIEALLWHIIEGTTTDEEPQSRNEAILTAIANSTEYDEDPQSRIEAFLIAILNHEEINIEPISRNEAILKAIANSGEYDKEPQSRNEELLLKWLDAWGVVIATVGPATIASFYTSLALPLVSLKASIVATESGSGTKSPTNPYTLGGFSNAVITRSGVNLWNEQVLNGYLSSTDGSFIASANSICSKNFCPCVSGSTLYVAIFASPSLYVVFYDKNKAFISRALGNNQSVSVPNNACYFRVSVYRYGTTYGNDISVNYPSTDTDYHAYTETQITIDLGQTVYGGEIVLTKKASGYGVKLRVTHVKLTEEELRSYNWSIGGTNNNLFGTMLGNTYVFPTGANEKGDVLSDIYENVGYTTINTATQAYQIALRKDKTIRIKDDRYATLQDFKDNLGNLNVILQLATPIEIDLTDASDIVALVGTNNVWSDTGDVEVSYKKKQTD